MEQDKLVLRPDKQLAEALAKSAQRDLRTPPQQALFLLRRALLAPDAQAQPAATP